MKQSTRNFVVFLVCLSVPFLAVIGFGLLARFGGQ